MRRVACIAAFLITGSTSALPQSADSTRTPASFWASGLSIGLPGVGRETEPVLFTLGGSFTRITPGLGADLAIMTMPRIFAEGAIPIFARVGAALPMRLDAGSYILPIAGVGGAGIVAEGGAGGILGLYLGAAFMSFGDRSGFRAAYTLNQFEGESVWLLEIGWVGRPAAK